MSWISGLGLEASLGFFALIAVIIAVVGTRLTHIADDLADRTGLGEAIAGAVLLGAATSLSGIVVSVTAALKGEPELAMSNALGGIAVQTVFLAIADGVYQRANLEHAAASTANLAQSALLICLLSLLLLAPYTPAYTLLGIHPATLVLFVGYGFGLRVVNDAEQLRMWAPRETGETREDRPDDSALSRSLISLWLGFLALAALLGLSGFVLEIVASRIGEQTGLGATAVGVILTAICTSLPELVTSIAAVRRGALQLAVGGIIGGNAFDCLFAGAADLAYRDGSIYHAVPEQTLLWMALSILMTGVLLLGLIRREKNGVGNIGFESATMVVLYGFGIATAVLAA
ncbi:sodium/calcium exchanger membrane protein [Salinisphaera shabanensis T35B1]|uniref:Cation transporter protein n=1 Tax=Salinisphaera shabanensis E1L3A TaxID=1033802 RepID=U2E8X9_9GAMM|nr:cation transporter [Salinisphaera shabanensis]ERJ20156.1 Putative cation transporter protein [Salinisphaera shabanensis E1L3A]